MSEGREGREEPGRPLGFTRAGHLGVLCAGGALALDQVTKALALAYAPVLETGIEVLPVFISCSSSTAVSASAS